MIPRIWGKCVPRRCFSAPAREYFYHLDSKGQVFLEETKHRNFVTCLKDVPFLTFFFRNLRRNSTGQRSSYPLLSPCGTELNFVSIDDRLASTVFSQLLEKGDGQLELRMGGSSVAQPFNPALLAVDPSTGRFYHTVSNHRYLEGKYGLIHSLLAERLSPFITVEDDTFVLQWKDGSRYPIVAIDS